MVGKNDHFTPQEQSDEEAQCQPLEEFALKKPAVGLFHNSSAESEAPGTEFNSLISKKKIKKPDP
jgi:hypothetical protein